MVYGHNDLEPAACKPPHALTRSVEFANWGDKKSRFRGAKYNGICHCVSMANTTHDVVAVHLPSVWIHGGQMKKGD